MQSRVEDILQAMIDGTESSELPKPQSRNEDLLLQVLDKMNEGGGGGGGAAIDDSTISTTKTWSSSKINATKLDTNQGSANSGKIMGVDATGAVVPVEVEGGNIAVTETPVSGDDYSMDIVEGAGGGAVTDVQIDGTSILDAHGVADVPVATNKSPGVAMFNSTYGIRMADGYAVIQYASNDNIKGGNSDYRPIVPTKQHQSTFYGLAKAAGDATQSASSNAVGNYTDNAKSAIHEMLNGSVIVTGTTPTITALPGIRYVCGEVATLDITLPASGIVDVVFESGSTATVLTITPPTGQTIKWANGFDPTTLDANTTYEINIADGLGVAASWT